MLSGAWSSLSTLWRANQTVSQVSPPVTGEQSETGEEDPDPVQEALPLAGEQTDNEPMPGEGKPEPAQVASFLASEQSDNKAMPVEGEPELAPALVG